MISTADFAPIAALDFAAIKTKLMHRSGQGWSRERTDAAEYEYRRFLFLMKKFPHEPTAPLHDVDTFWHYHILDTMKYADDCGKVFGYFLHHFPYAGMRGEDDAAALRRMGERMRGIYESTFGEAYPGAGAAPGTAVPQQAAFCGATAAAAPAFCGAAVEAAPAFCGAAVEAAPAFCGAAIKADAAFCGAAVKAGADAGGPIETRPDFYTVRPTLG